MLRQGGGVFVVDGTYPHRMPPTIRTAPARWPFAMAYMDGKQVPCLVLRWERGHGQSPQEWNARIVYERDGEACDALVLYRFIKPVGRGTPPGA